MDSALIISFSKKSIEYLTEILEEASVTNITAISTACEARCILKEKEYDLCIINAPLPDEFGDCLAREITEKQTSEVILIVKSELFEEVSDRVEEFGDNHSQTNRKAFFQKCPEAGFCHS